MTDLEEEAPTPAPSTPEAPTEAPLSSPGSDAPVEAPPVETPAASASAVFDEKVGRHRVGGKFAKNPDAAPVEAPVADPAAADGAVATEPAPPSAPVLPEGTPWSFKAGGQQFRLGNAQLVPGVGVVIPEGDIDAMHRTLGQAAQLQMDRAKLDREMASEREKFAAEKEFISKASEHWQHLARLVREGGEQGLRQAVEDLLDYAHQEPTLRAEARAKVLEQQLHARVQADQPSPDQVRHAAMEDADAQLGEMLHGLRTRHTDLTDGDWQEVAQGVAVLLNRLVVQADRDYPDHGIARGDWVLDEDAAQQLMDREVRRQLTVAQARKGAEQRAKAEADQKRRTTSTIAAPPVAAGTPAAVPNAPVIQKITDVESLTRFLRS